MRLQLYLAQSQDLNSSKETNNVTNAILMNLESVNLLVSSLLHQQQHQLEQIIPRLQINKKL